MTTAEISTVYSETSRPAWFWWPAGLFVIACIAIAYGAMLGTAWGIGVMVVGTLILALMVRLGSWRLTLDSTSLRVGSAGVPASRISGAESLDPDSARLLAGQNADARAVFKLRGGSPAVRVDLTDPNCPYWLISSRNPDALAAAVNRVAAQNPAQ